MSSVEIRLPSGEVRMLNGGELIGRAAGAQVRIDNAHVSEAHAFVAHRGDGLCLQALRGPLLVDGRPCPEVVLTPGVVVMLAPSALIEVLSADAGDGSSTTETVPWMEVLAFRVTLEGVALTVGEDVHWFRGKLGLLVAELLRCDEPVSWKRLARPVWPRPSDRLREEWDAVVRKRLDAMLRRLRDDLKKIGVKRALVTVGSGQIGLALRTTDTIVFDD